MNILIKYPTRGRPSQFIEGLKSIVDNLHDVRTIYIAVIIDRDDPTMNNEAMESAIREFPRTFIFKGSSTSKIDAVNREVQLGQVSESPNALAELIVFDIIMVMSDDMRLSFHFDHVIKNQFSDGNFDKLLHFPDQDAKSALATMYIAGKTFYNRFGYVYNPSYKSLFCDNEIMEVAQALGCYYFVDYPGIVTHLNPAYGHGVKDQMFIEQQHIGYTYDRENYLTRKAERLNCTTEEALLDYLTKFNERK